MNGPQLLAETVGRIRSRVGAVFIGSHAVFRGKDLHAELGDASWLDLYLFGITGRRFSGPKLRMLEAMWTYTSYPDARIWNNRVAALAGTTRSTGNLGVTAALGVSEAKIYGQGPTYRAIEFLIRLRAHLDAGGDLGALVEKELSRQGCVAGYGQPVSGGKDERIEPLLRLARSLGLSDGPHLKLVYAVDAYLSSTGRARQRMNGAGFVAGLSADLGLSPREQYFFLFPAFLAGMVPCYMDAAARTEGTVLPLPCDGVAYVGVAKRRWANR
ncbi:MAG: citryl-CoA lyase [Polyangiaceae bacterium]